MKNPKPKKASEAQLAIIDTLQVGNSWLWTDVSCAYLATRQEDGTVKSKFVNAWTFRGLKASGAIRLNKQTGHWTLTLQRC